MTVRTIRIKSNVLERVDALAKSQGRSSNDQIEVILQERFGYTHMTRVEEAEDGFFYISPSGVYGELDRTKWLLIKQGIELTDGESWTETFGSIDEVNIGSPVCKQTPQGIVVLDMARFKELLKLYDTID